MNQHHDIVIVGAGFSGIGTAITLRDAGFTDLCALLLDIAKKQQTVGDRVIELGADAVPGRINEALRNRISEQLAHL